MVTSGPQTLPAGAKAYSRVAIVLHWLIAAAIILQLVLALPLPAAVAGR